MTAKKVYDQSLQRTIRHDHTADLDSRYLQTGASAGGDLSGTYPNPAVQDDSHNHTDLVPYAGATSDVNLGEFGVLSGLEATEGYVYAPDATTANTDGGSFGVYAGASTGSGAGGTASLVAGPSQTTGIGGDISIRAGVGGSSSGNGGTVGISAGATRGGDSDGGSITITGGVGHGTGTGGTISLQAGGGGASGDGASIAYSAGNGGITTGMGGNITFIAGSALGGDNNGGSVSFRVGGKSGSGSNGVYQFQGPTGEYAILNTSSIATSNKTFTFPNNTGTFALSDLPIFVIGNGAAGVDYQIKVDGETNDGLITWKEDEDYWQFDDDIYPQQRLLLPMGEISYFDMTGTAITITTQSDGSTNMVVCNPTTALNNDLEFDNGGSNNGRLRYIGATTKMFHVACTISISPTTANDTFVFGVAKGGTVIASSKVLLQATTSSGIRSTALHVMVSLATNDYLELYVGNTTDTDDCTIHSLNLFAMGM